MTTTASVCLTLLLSGGPKMGTAQPSEQSAARDWLQSMNIAAPTEERVNEVLKQWQLWKTMTPVAQDAHLALEIKNISPPGESSIASFSGRAQLQTLSTANLSRLKEQISARLPLASEPTSAVLALVEAIKERVAFHYLQPYRASRETGVYPPLPSPRELAKLKIDYEPSYYSRMVGKTASVGFTMIATKRDQSPYYLNAGVPYTAYRLRNEIAETAGFVLPNFTSVNGALTFFSEWEPQAMETLFRQNRMSLPAQINTVRKFLMFLDPSRVKEVFPDHSAFERLAVLREALSNYVLTEPDARTLLLWAFERWLLSVAAEDRQEFDRIFKEFALAAGIQSVFAKKFLPELGLPDLVLRVPGAVSPQSFSILRIENVAYNPFPDYGSRVQPRWDSRRLDHESKP